jgi:cell division protein FtsN
MSRDYKPRPEKAASSKKGSPLLTGLLIGFLLGVAASLSVVMFIKGGESPFTELASQDKSVADKIKANVEADASKPVASTDSASSEDKTRFDFYTILPNSESKVSAEEERKLEAKVPQPVVQQSYFLQAGAFQSEDEADNMKAKLALQGFEALVQTATIPDKGVWHRVRVGPLKDLEQINKTKSDLLSNGFKADLIKINNENQ